VRAVGLQFPRSSAIQVGNKKSNPKIKEKAMTRKLASIQEVYDISSIDGADRIQKASVMGWNVVVKKDEFREHDKCVFFEIDSILPDDKDWAQFLQPRKYRVKTCKLRGVLSQGLALPLSILPTQKDWQIDEDVSELLGVVKYEPPIDAKIGGVTKGTFPSFIPKTDEPRVQSSGYLLRELQGLPYCITEKVDGSSGTFYRDEEGFHVCSRNLELKEDDNNAFWIVAKKYDLPNRLPVGVALQGEVHGPGIQKNRLGLKELDLAVFTAFDFRKGKRLSWSDTEEICNDVCVPIVDVVEVGDSFSHTKESLLELAKGKYRGTKNNREGIVIRSRDAVNSKRNGSPISFKTINNDFLLKEEG
jgi:RNA ligase (TIGR02306 family)